MLYDMICHNMKYTMNTKKLKGGQLNLPCGNITKRNENRTHPRPSP